MYYNRQSMKEQKKHPALMVGGDVSWMEFLCGADLHTGRGYGS